jgi:hypothetical protein
MRNQALFEAPFVSEVSTKYCSKCSRLGAGKCVCKRCMGEASPSFNTRAYSKPNDEAQWLFEAPSSTHASYYSNIDTEWEYENHCLFESPYTNQEYYNDHSEADAMFGWAKKKWQQWRGRRANPSSSLPLPSSSAKLDVSTLVRQLDLAPNSNRSLTREERDALTQVVTNLISRSILKKKQEILDPNSLPERKQYLRNNLTRLVNLGRFRFLKQLPQLRNRFIQALDGTDVKFPH